MPVLPATPGDHSVNGGRDKALMIEMAMRHERDLARNGTYSGTTSNCVSWNLAEERKNLKRLLGNEQCGYSRDSNRLFNTLAEWKDCLENGFAVQDGARASVTLAGITHKWSFPPGREWMNQPLDSGLRRNDGGIEMVLSVRVFGLRLPPPSSFQRRLESKWSRQYMLAQASMTIINAGRAASGTSRRGRWAGVSGRLHG